LDFSNKYIFFFALVVCLVCSLVVSLFAVGLKEKQEINKALFQQKNILLVAGLLEEGAHPTKAEVDRAFADVHCYTADRRSGEILEEVEFGTYDVVKAAKDPAQSTPSVNQAQVPALPDKLFVCHVMTPGKECWVLPIWGNGLWSTMYGYLALEPDLETVRGITYYDEGETPGLGGEVENPLWKAQWRGKKIHRGKELALRVTKHGHTEDPTYDVDGISGASITSRSVSFMIHLWLGDEGYGPFLTAQKQKGAKE